MRVLFTTRSENHKTGKIPVSMTDGASCPPVCRLREVCYAMGGGLGATWIRLTRGVLPGMPWDTFCERIAALPKDVRVWRHNQAGDLPGAANKLDRDLAFQLALANKAKGYNRGGFTYTHYSPLPGNGVDPEVADHNASVISDLNSAGFAVNLSGDSPEHADQLAGLGIGPVVTLLQRDVTKGFKLASGRTVVLCPAITRGVSCADCRLCSNRSRKVIVGFPAHGRSRNKASNLAAESPTF